MADKKKQKAISIEEFKTKAPKPKREPRYPRNKKELGVNKDKLEIIRSNLDLIQKPITRQKRLDELDPPKAKRLDELEVGKPIPFKNGGSVRIAKRGGGRAYGKNS